MNDIILLLDKICQVSEKHKKIEEAKGGNYNLFRVIDMTSNETSVHSAFIADLLNPKGLHRTGTVFLDLFIKQVLPDMDFETKGAKVEREKYIGPVTEETGGRLDIIITDNSGKAIIIENKIYASDQENQMIRYHNYAESLRSDYALLYLSLDGEVHNEEKTGKGKLMKDKDYRTISYESDVLEWLWQCREVVADKPLIREGISHYINLIKYLTRQTLNKDMENDLKTLILNKRNYLRNIGVIKCAVELTGIELQERFWRTLKEQMEKNGYEVAPAPAGNSNYVYALETGRIKRFYENTKDNHYGLEFAIGKYKDSTIYYAFRMHTPLKCGFLARRISQNSRKPITDYDYYAELQAPCCNPRPSAYTRDKAGWYLWCKKVEPELDFKKLDYSTLECLINMEDTIRKITRTATEDIEFMKAKLKKLSC